MEIAIIYLTGVFSGILLCILVFNASSLSANNTLINGQIKKYQDRLLLADNDKLRLISKIEKLSGRENCID